MQNLKSFLLFETPNITHKDSTGNTETFKNEKGPEPNFLGLNCKTFRPGPEEREPE